MNEQSANPAAQRVLHLVHGLNRGGIEIWLLEMMQYISRQKLEMDVCCKGPELGVLAEDFRQAGANVIHLPQKRNPLVFVRALRDLLIRMRYDAIHVHTGAHSSWSVRAAQSAGVPVITTFHNTRFPRESKWTSSPLLGQAVKQYTSWSIRYAVKKSQLVTGVSQGSADVVQKISRVQKPKCEVVYLGVEDPLVISQGEIEQKRKALQLTSADKVFIHVGSLTEQKNHLGLLEVFRLIHKKIPQARLLIVGTGPCREVIEQRTGELGLQDSAQLLGLRTDVSELMQASDLLLFPSIREGLSLALMEASAARLPIVASNIPGNFEATAGGKTGRLHEVEDYAAMANSACELVQQPALAAEITHSARRVYEQNFSLETSATRWQDLYRRVIADFTGERLLQSSSSLPEKAA
ncbi:MAG: glycosyltransferase [Pirellulales bacterium]|nr:glycosyltransferase [Pirellulales bacterium]